MNKEINQYIHEEKKTKQKERKRKKLINKYINK